MVVAEREGMNGSSCCRCCWRHGAWMQSCTRKRIEHGDLESACVETEGRAQQTTSLERNQKKEAIDGAVELRNSRNDALIELGLGGRQNRWMDPWRAGSVAKGDSARQPAGPPGGTGRPGPPTTVMVNAVQGRGACQ